MDKDTLLSSFGKWVAPINSGTRQSRQFEWNNMVTNLSIYWGSVNERNSSPDLRSQG
jgi:hypothetical protein